MDIFMQRAGYYNSPSDVEMFNAIVIILIAIAMIGLIITVVYLVIKSNKNNEELNHRIDYLVDIISKDTSIEDIDRKYECLSLLDEIIYCDPLNDVNMRRLRYNLFLSKSNLVFLRDANINNLMSLATDQLEQLESDIEANYAKYTSSDKQHIISFLHTHQAEPYYKLLNYELNATLLDIKEHLSTQLPVSVKES